MSENENKKSKKIFDKVVMGAIIGGAIGSVIGASVGTKNKTEEASGKVAEKHGNFVKKILGIFRRKSERTAGSAKKIPNEMEEYKK